MIKEIELECDYIRQVESKFRDNQIKVLMENVNESFIADLRPEDIVMHQDTDALLEAIGADRVGEWYMNLGGQR